MQGAPTVVGIWNDLSAAASPYLVPLTNNAAWFRLRLPGTLAPSGLVSWWPGNGNAADVVGTNNGILHGDVSFDPGEVGQAFNLDGSSGWIEVPSSDSLNPTGPFSVECWVKASSVQYYVQVLIMDKSHGFTDGTGWGLQTDPGGTVGFFFGIGGNSGDPSYFPGVRTDSNLLDDRWHHLAGVWTGTAIQIYFDGALEHAGDLNGPPVNNTRSVEIGAAWGGGQPTRFFHGLIDEASYYNVALTPQQISAIYNAGPGGKWRP